MYLQHVLKVTNMAIQCIRGHNQHHAGNAVESLTWEVPSVA